MPRIFIASTPWNPDKKWYGPPCKKVGVAIKISGTEGKRTFVAGGTNLRDIPLLITEVLSSVKGDDEVQIFADSGYAESVKKIASYVFKDRPFNINTISKAQRGESSEMYDLAKVGSISMKKQFFDKDMKLMK